MEATGQDSEETEVDKDYQKKASSQQQGAVMQVASGQAPNFTCGCLLLISEVMKVGPSLEDGHSKLVFVALQLAVFVQSIAYAELLAQSKRSFPSL